jgi:hypothetical protein
MSDCAKCDKPVNVPDGYEFNEGDMCWPCMAKEVEEELLLRERLSAILDATANALHGGPMKNGLWSFHDLPELALEAMNRIAKLEDCIRELLKGADGFNAVVKKEEAARKLLG